MSTVKGRVLNAQCQYKRGGLTLAAAPHREWKAAQNSAVWGCKEGQRILHGAVSEQSKRELGKGFAPEGGGHETALQGSG